MKQSIKGYIPKREEQRAPDFGQGIASVTILINELHNTKKDVVSTVDQKIKEVDGVLEKANITLDKKVNDIDQTISDAKTTIQDTTDQALAHIKDIKQGEPGKDADHEQIVKDVLDQIPKFDEEAFSTSLLNKVPKINEDALLKKFIQKIPENKASLKIIQEKFEIDPMSVIEKIMSMPEGKFKLKTSNVDGLEQTMNAFRSQLGRGYLHGGGDTVVAGTNITIVTNANGQKVISSTGGGGTPATPVHSIQYNNPLGTFAGDANFIRDITDATNRYGMYIGPVSGATNNWNIYSGPAISSFNARIQSDGWLSLAPNVLAGLNLGAGFGAASFVHENNAATTFGAFFVAGTTATNATFVEAGDSEAYFLGTGTLTNLIGHNFVVRNVSTGTVTTASGVRITNAENSGGGAITTQVGLNILTQTRGATNYAIMTGASGGFLFGSLAGTGNRIVSASATGVLSASNTVTDLTVTNAPTFSAMTSGSVLFAGTAGLLSQDNANYFYDATNHNLRIGPTSAAITTENRLSVIGNANDYHGTFTQNVNAGTLSSTDVVVSNDLGVSDATTYADFGVNSSGNTNAAMTGFRGSDAYLFTSGQIKAINIATGGANPVRFFYNGYAIANEVAETTASGFQIGLTGTLTGQLKLLGSTSGTISILGQNAAGTYNFNLPITAGSAGQVLTSQGGGSTAMTWSSASGLTWTAVTVNATFTVNTGTLANKGTLLSMALPTTSAVGDVVAIAGMNAGLWKITQAASQQIHFGNQNTTSGTGGSLASVLTYDAVYLVCSVANLEWVVINSMGNITVV